MSKECSRCSAWHTIDRPLFDGEQLPQLAAQVMKLEPKAGDTLVFRSVGTGEMWPLNDAIRRMRERKTLPESVEVLILGSEVELNHLPLVKDTTVQVSQLSGLTRGSVIVAKGLPLYLQRHLNITLRESGLMPPGCALVALPEGTASIETMEREKLVELLNHLLGKK